MNYKIFLFLGIIIFLLFSIRFLVPAVVFMPSARLVATPSDHNIAYEDISLITEDNIRLHGWYMPVNNARATLLFFHGNAGNISHRIGSFKIFQELGLSVFILSYRGYGSSEGKPSINGTKIDALAAWQWLTTEKNIPAENIVIFGRSLGGAVAMELMRSVSPGALILESTFSSLADMSPFPKSIAPLLLGGNFWNSEETAAGLTVPTLVIHSPADEVVPYWQGRAIYHAIPGEKTFLQIEGDHNSGFMQSMNLYLPGLDAFLTKHF